MPLAWLQVGGAVPTTPWQMVTHATTVTQLVLVILVVLSLVSWAVMIAKWREFGRVMAAGRAFTGEFERAAGPEEADAIARRSPSSPFTRVFMRGINFFAEMKPGAPRDAAAGPPPHTPVPAPPP